MVNIPLKREQPGERFSAAINQELYGKPRKKRRSPAKEPRRPGSRKPQPRKSDPKTQRPETPHPHITPNLRPKDRPTNLGIDVTLGVWWWWW